MQSDPLNQPQSEPQPPWTGRAAVFQMGRFLLRSGQESNWKIEMDNLTPEDWAGLAAIAVEFLPLFGEVIGVPRGGIPFANALRLYCTLGCGLLLAEDVFTSGGSLLRFRESLGQRAANADAVVAFARGRVFGWVYPVFSLYGCGIVT